MANEWEVLYLICYYTDAYFLFETIQVVIIGKRRRNGLEFAKRNALKDAIISTNRIEYQNKFGLLIILKKKVIFILIKIWKNHSVSITNPNML